MVFTPFNEVKNFISTNSQVSTYSDTPDLGEFTGIEFARKGGVIILKSIFKVRNAIDFTILLQSNKVLSESIKHICG